MSGKGVVELQAQLYRTQEQARMRADGLPGMQDKEVRRKAGRVIQFLNMPRYWHPAAGTGCMSSKVQQQQAEFDACQSPCYAAFKDALHM